MQKVPFLKSTEYVPTQEFILVKPIDPKENKTESGIILTQAKASVMDRPTYGEVVAVGPKVEQIEKGSLIFWPASDGLDFEFGDGEFKLIRDKSVIGIHVKE